ncbi:hypothetical protein CDN99_25430 [Roseateles aquatilis]|uniref:Uncharacterized protein n=1 Tax=Roseateles aquatilis TaxID=431061 RepID=A0A246IUB0_9BURK|nr:hypothetical protein [Roseateles aquatilis]OWQ83810.1 hypothetical protein CDN99_25430 [Roseateles aquatilis]
MGAMNAPLSIDTSGTDREVASWIWHHLVPPQGQAATIQGELLRAVEKLRWEAQENGNANWDEGFLILLAFLEDRLGGQAGVGDADRQTIQEDIHRLRNFSPLSALDDGLGDEFSEGFDGDIDAELDDDRLPYVDDDLYDRLEHFVVAFARANPVALPHVANPRLLR